MERSSLYSIYLSHPVICIDSRKVTLGCIFFSLKGDNFDGNQYAQKALEAGAAFAVVDNYEMVKNDQYIYVEDVLQSLQSLASEHRQHLKAIVIALTGSNGKTTTKELVREVLKQKYKVLATAGNLNNHIGVPLTLLSAKKDDEFVIVEMGANHQGEISVLCKIATPDYVMITNIGKAHMEGFGGIEGIKKGKSEIYKYASENNKMVFCNSDDKVLMELLPSNIKIISYSTKSLIQLLQTEPTISFEYLNNVIQSNLFGLYNSSNLAFAVKVGAYFDIDVDSIKRAIENYLPENNRSQLTQLGENTIVKDAYNANPTSMKLSIESLAAMDKKQKVVILGDMLELGEYSLFEHKTIINLVLQLKIDHCIFVGKQFFEAGQGLDGHYFLSIEDAKAYFKSCRFEKALILLKGSRGIAIEKILES
jgi:UDP-N-acetylmuramoyl-tripeptide--D-alanyl-D-alanine ligase